MNGRVLVAGDDLALAEMLRGAGLTPRFVTDSDRTITALRSGADDYIVKPFQSKVLIARIRARLERK